MDYIKSIDVLKEVADYGDYATNYNEETGIIKLFFRVNGVQVKAQADIDNAGIYGITIDSINDLKKMVKHTN